MELVPKTCPVKFDFTNWNFFFVPLHDNQMLIETLWFVRENSVNINLIIVESEKYYMISVVLNLETIA